MFRVSHFPVCNILLGQSNTCFSFWFQMSQENLIEIWHLKLYPVSFPFFLSHLLFIVEIHNIEIHVLDRKRWERFPLQPNAGHPKQTSKFSHIFSDIVFQKTPTVQCPPQEDFPNCLTPVYFIFLLIVQGSFFFLYAVYRWVPRIANESNFPNTKKEHLHGWTFLA